jgi:exonuclease SbcD
VGRGGITLGGGERQAQTVLDYHLAPDVFPLALDYVALGHIHRAQNLHGPTTIRYAGSPMSLDFGEAGRDPKGVDIVEVEPGRPAKVDTVPLQSRPLLTLSGTVEELVTQAADLDVDAHLRLRVAETPRHGLADELRTRIPAAVEIRVDAAHDPSRKELDGTDRLDQDPAVLFAEYLEQAGMSARADLAGRFAQLLEHVTATAGTVDLTGQEG